MAPHEDLRFQDVNPWEGCVEVMDLKPEQHAVSVWPERWIADTAMVMFHIPPVQLKDEPALPNQPLVLTPAMRTLAAQQSLIPATARLNIAHANKGLWIHATNLILAKGI